MSILTDMDACVGGRDWADSQKSYRAAWDACDRGDWMLWIAQERNIDLKISTLARVKCVRLVEHLMIDMWSLRALLAAERFSAGNASLAELNDAAGTAYATYASSAYQQYPFAYADAPYAADSYAAYAVYAYARAHADVDASQVVNVTYEADAWAYFGPEILKKCADICREVIDFDLLKIGDTNE